ncbi:hypothetical protein ACE38W_01115 [Chitinophaga sp. Hz27]|uniref:hypothetical protein n=1 Tax=Chitinophaga sp. Hz27 TaxID=3347169 RepID=UPI0035D6BFEB
MKFISVALLSLSLIVLNGCTRDAVTADPQLQRLSAGKKSATITTNLEGDVYDVVRQHTMTVEFQQDHLLQIKNGVRRMRQLNISSLPSNQQLSALKADSIYNDIIHQELADVCNYLWAMGKSNGTITVDDLPFAGAENSCYSIYQQDMKLLAEDFIKYLKTYNPGSPIILLPMALPDAKLATDISGFRDRLYGITFSYRMCQFFQSADEVPIDPGPVVDGEVAESTKTKAKFIDQEIINAFESYNLGQLDNDPFPVYDNYTNTDIVYIITQTYMVHFNRASNYSMTEIHDYIYSNYQQIMLPLTRPLPDFMQPHL